MQMSCRLSSRIVLLHDMRGYSGHPSEVVATLPIDEAFAIAPTRGTHAGRALNTRIQRRNAANSIHLATKQSCRVSGATLIWCAPGPRQNVRVLFSYPLTCQTEWIALDFSLLTHSRPNASAPKSHPGAMTHPQGWLGQVSNAGPVMPMREANADEGDPLLAAAPATMAD